MKSYEDVFERNFATPSVTTTKIKESASGDGYLKLSVSLSPIHNIASRHKIYHIMLCLMCSQI